MVYSDSDFERFYLRYMAEAMPRGESIQAFCSRNKIPYNLFDKWHTDTRHKVVPVNVTGRPEAREGDVFIMMSKNPRLVRMFSYDSHSCSLHEKRFHPGYSFMKVERDGDRKVFSVEGKDVLTLMESPVIKSLRISKLT